MATITNFTATTIAGVPLLADAYGNNVAFQCPSCGAPVLAVVLANMKGSSADKPATCRACESRYWIEVVVPESRLLVHALPGEKPGRLRLGRAPSVTAEHNMVSWSVVTAMLEAYGGADYEDLIGAVRQHANPGGGKGFIDYCIRNGWLVHA